MILIEHDIQIEAPIEKVFNYVSDPTNDPEWCPPILEVKQEKGTEPAEGSQYHVKSKRGGKVNQGPCEIVELRPNEWIKREGRNQTLRYDYTYEFSSNGKGTNIHIRRELRLKGLYRFMKHVIKASSKEEVEEEIENLKKIMEE